MEKISAKDRSTTNSLLLHAYVYPLLVGAGILSQIIANNAYASSCTMLWNPEGGYVRNANIALSDQNPVTTTTFVGGPDVSAAIIGWSTGPIGAHGSGINRRGAWLVFPKSVSAGGANINISVKDSNGYYRVPGWVDPNKNAYTTVATSPSGDLGCERPGYRYPNLHWYTPGAIVELSLDSGGAQVTGTYTVNIPYKYAYEEQKASPGDVQTGDRGGMYSYINSLPDRSFSVKMTIVNRCTYDTSPINLNHGTMTPAESVKNRTKPYGVRINCTGAQKVSANLLGLEQVDGRTNYTKCGMGGACELLLDGDKGNTILDVNGTTILSITSTYHPSMGSPVAGKFEGSGVLSLFIH